MTGRIWLIGGTQESAQLARMIACANLPCTVSVTTEAARSLYPVAPCLTVRVGTLTVEQLHPFLRSEAIVAVLDASHPFAVAVSELAIAACARFTLPYLRYERPQLNQGLKQESGETREPEHRGAGAASGWMPCHLPDFEALLTGNYLEQQRVLLTIGYRPLALFHAWQKRATLFARILPSVVALDAALAAGFSSDRLIALRPPISAELERSLWQQWQISMVVTKASGSAGGEDVKRQVATELSIPLITIDRPSLAYPAQTNDLQVALQFCQRHLQAGSA